MYVSTIWSNNISNQSAIKSWLKPVKATGPANTSNSRLLANPAPKYKKMLKIILGI